jgi:TldD protein
LSRALDIATADLLHPGGLGETELQATLGQLMDRRLDLADMYFQATRFESWALEDGIVKDGSYNIDQGVGVRAVSGDKTGFAYSDEIALPALTQSAQAARAIAHSSGSGTVQAWHRRKDQDLYASVDPLTSLSEQQRISLL